MPASILQMQAFHESETWNNPRL